MCLAGIEPAFYLVGATLNPAFTWTAAVLATETPGLRGGCAVRHRARLMVSTTVYKAMWRYTTGCVGGAAIKLALALSTVLVADTTRLRKGGAAFCLAHSLVAMTAVPVAVSFCFRCGSSCAVVERAEPKGAVLHAEATSIRSCTTPISRADLLVPSMRMTKPSS